MRFVLLTWLATRAAIAAVLYLASPHPLASAGNWDGAWYGSIALHGYQHASIGAQRDIAFFPLFPMMAAVLLHAGLRWPLAGILVNNACFLAALFVIYALAHERWSRQTARWCVAVAASCPLSLFASVAYHEGVFLLFSALALFATLRADRLRGGIAGALASATSAMGIALAGALALDAIVQRRGARAIACALLAFAGAGAFAIFCYARFGDPLSFVHAQHAWRTAGFDGGAWLRIFASLSSWDGLRRNVMVVVLVPLAAVAVLLQRKALGSLMTSYALLAIALLLFAGEPISADRNAFTFVPVLLAYGRALERVPVAGGAALAASLALLAYDTAQFANFHWVA
ncbi:MAG TPA: hypothetical protein VMA98_04365 [Candidatus Acidoferrales bacterium]|nr:hypothetical protein [Candidatus Acidoferrales bacterium]